MAETVVPFEEIQRKAAAFELERVKVEAHARKVTPISDTVRAGYADDPLIADQRRYRTGIHSIDRAAGDFRPGNLALISALTGFGKTSLLEQVMEHNAHDRTVFCASLEMTEAEIEANMTARRMGFRLEDYERERRADSVAYKQARDYIRSLNLHLWRPPIGREASIEDIFTRAERVGADIVAVDYVKLLEGWLPGTPANRMVGYMQAAAQGTGIFTLMLSQLRTSAIGRRPTLDDLDDAKRLGHASSTVLLIHRPFAGKGDKGRDVIAEIICAKNRKGEAFFRAHTHWYGPCHTFYSMTEEDESRVECCKKKPAKGKESSEESGMMVAVDAVLAETPAAAPECGGEYPGEDELTFDGETSPF